MGKHALTFFIIIFCSVSFADEKTDIVQTDLKFLCQIKKMEKSLYKDRSLSAADTAERFSTIKMAAVKAQETKDALSAVAMADKKEQSKLWLQFAKDHKVKTDCL